MKLSRNILKIGILAFYFRIWDDASDEVILRPRRLLRSRWGDPPATASLLSFRELQPSRRLATPHWSALEEVSARSPSSFGPKRFVYPPGGKTTPGGGLTLGLRWGAPILPLGKNLPTLTH